MLGLEALKALECISQVKDPQLRELLREGFAVQAVYARMHEQDREEVGASDLHEGGREGGREEGREGGEEGKDELVGISK